uniref:Uncharacterized protein n=1 Tax=Chromera velia CCMP2878 TaxID=1169474 RepID=A0A0G4HAV6_9ALVE|eukprot:Cvel_25645.t1-p1 / transcript=Cvel_25645.t1 / gene=Cvel_25645 / organism=Chromera_velia_CCMP2878 / gene_product=Host cell factor, putative / transcript_product=Host cell factor, putative / location=Cvel_scaffold2933:11281-21102(+) / protein_length=2222 / sequence_SO=supercontig / SO=protein_coding / is_pseudo=false
MARRQNFRRRNLAGGVPGMVQQDMPQKACGHLLSVGKDDDFDLLEEQEPAESLHDRERSPSPSFPSAKKSGTRGAKGSRGRSKSAAQKPPSAMYKGEGEASELSRGSSTACSAGASLEFSSFMEGGGESVARTVSSTSSLLPSGQTSAEPHFVPFVPMQPVQTPGKFPQIPILPVGTLPRSASTLPSHSSSSSTNSGIMAPPFQQEHHHQMQQQQQPSGKKRKSAGERPSGPPPPTDPLSVDFRGAPPPPGQTLGQQYLYQQRLLSAVAARSSPSPSPSGLWNFFLNSGLSGNPLSSVYYSQMGMAPTPSQQHSAMLERIRAFQSQPTAAFPFIPMQPVSASPTPPSSQEKGAGGKGKRGSPGGEKEKEERKKRKQSAGVPGSLGPPCPVQISQVTVEAVLYRDVPPSTAAAGGAADGTVFGLRTCSEVEAERKRQAMAEKRRREANIRVQAHAAAPLRARQHGPPRPVLVPALSFTVETALYRQTPDSRLETKSEIMHERWKVRLAQLQEGREERRQEAQELKRMQTEERNQRLRERAYQREQEKREMQEAREAKKEEMRSARESKKEEIRSARESRREAKVKEREEKREAKEREKEESRRRRQMERDERLFWRQRGQEVVPVAIEIHSQEESDFLNVCPELLGFLMLCLSERELGALQGSCRMLRLSVQAFVERHSMVRMLSGNLHVESVTLVTEPEERPDLTENPPDVPHRLPQKLLQPRKSMVFAVLPLPPAGSLGALSRCTALGSDRAPPPLPPLPAPRLGGGVRGEGEDVGEGPVDGGEGEEDFPTGQGGSLLHSLPPAQADVDPSEDPLGALAAFRRGAFPPPLSRPAGGEGTPLGLSGSRERDTQDDWREEDGVDPEEELLLSERAEWEAAVEPQSLVVAGGYGLYDMYDTEVAMPCCETWTLPLQKMGKVGDRTILQNELGRCVPDFQALPDIQGGRGRAGVDSAVGTLSLSARPDRGDLTLMGGTDGMGTGRRRRSQPPLSGVSSETDHKSPLMDTPLSLFQGWWNHPGWMTEAVLEQNDTFRFHAADAVVVGNYLFRGVQDRQPKQKKTRSPGATNEQEPSAAAASSSSSSSSSSSGGVSQGVSGRGVGMGGFNDSGGITASPVILPSAAPDLDAADEPLGLDSEAELEGSKRRELEPLSSLSVFVFCYFYQGGNRATAKRRFDKVAVFSSESGKRKGKGMLCDAVREREEESRQGQQERESAAPQNPALSLEQQAAAALFDVPFGSAPERQFPSGVAAAASDASWRSYDAVGEVPSMREAYASCLWGQEPGSRFVIVHGGFQGNSLLGDCYALFLGADEWKNAQGNGGGVASAAAAALLAESRGRGGVSASQRSGAVFADDEPEDVDFFGGVEDPLGGEPQQKKEPGDKVPSPGAGLPPTDREEMKTDDLTVRAKTEECIREEENAEEKGEGVQDDDSPLSLLHKNEPKSVGQPKKKNSKPGKLTASVAQKEEEEDGEKEEADAEETPLSLVRGRKEKARTDYRTGRAGQKKREGEAKKKKKQLVVEDELEEEKEGEGSAPLCRSARRSASACASAKVPPKSDGLSKQEPRTRAASKSKEGHPAKETAKANPKAKAGSKGKKEQSASSAKPKPEAPITASRAKSARAKASSSSSSSSTAAAAAASKAVPPKKSTGGQRPGTRSMRKRRRSAPAASEATRRESQRLREAREAAKKTESESAQLRTVSTRNVKRKEGTDSASPSPSPSPSVSSSHPASASRRDGSHWREARRRRSGGSRMGPATPDGRFANFRWVRLQADPWRGPVEGMQGGGTSMEGSEGDEEGNENSGGSVPHPRFGHSLTVIRNRAFIFGGRGAASIGVGAGVSGFGAFTGKCPRWSASACHHQTAVLQDVWVLERLPERRHRGFGYQFKWSCPQVFGERPPPRASHAATAVGLHLAIFGGSNTRYLNDLWMLNTGNMIWAKVELPHLKPQPDAAPARSSSSSAASASRPETFGEEGEDKEGSSAAVSASSSSSSSAPAASSSSSAEAHGHSGCGGAAAAGESESADQPTGSSAVPQATVSSPSAPSPSQGPPLISARAESGLSFDGSHTLLIFGGSSRFSRDPRFARKKDFFGGLFCLRLSGKSTAERQMSRPFRARRERQSSRGLGGAGRAHSPPQCGGGGRGSTGRSGEGFPLAPAAQMGSAPRLVASSSSSLSGPPNGLTLPTFQLAPAQTSASPTSNQAPVLDSSPPVLVGEAVEAEVIEDADR